MSEEDASTSIVQLGKSLSIVLTLVLLVALVGGALAFEGVEEGTVSVEINKGEATGNILTPGWHLINPLTESTKTLSIRPQEYTMSSSDGEGDRANRNDQVDVLTNDGLDVGIDITVRYEVNQQKADLFYKEYRTRTQAESILIRPTVRAELRTQSGALDTNKIYTRDGQTQLRDSVKTVLEEEFEGTGLQLNAVQIRAVDLPNSYQDSISQKEVEKQKVEQKEVEIERTKLEKERKRVEAEADAEQIQIRGQALQENPVVLQQRQIEALKQGNTIYVPTNSGNGGVTLTRDVTATENATATPTP